MTITHTFSSIPNGFNADLITIEGDLAKGLYAFNIVGMANKTIEESRERIRSAIHNSGFAFPKDKITINLAPADTPKTGSFLDLPIAVSILALTGQLLASDLDQTMFVGELALDGKIRPIRGAINITELANKKTRIKRLFLPAANAVQASLIPLKKLSIIPVSSLTELVKILKGIVQPRPIQTVVKNTQTDNAYAYLDQIIGQTEAKRALVVAVAGHHNILLSGPPGVGKSMLASVIPDLLPPLSQPETIAATKLHSLTGNTTKIVTRRPFRTPHHSASSAAILGGGNGLPGEISLAHTGVLYLDELPEFRRDVLEALRQPLENKTISISRANRHQRYPADFMLVGTMNPCPCGYRGSDTHPCSCTESQVINYRRRISGPLLDRTDLTIQVQQVPQSVLLKTTTISTREHASAKRQIAAATERQFARQGKYNANLSSYELTQLCPLDKESEQVLSDAARRYSLSARAYFKVIKVARTIADLAGARAICSDDIYEALRYRHAF